jgi:RES domain-containing protein
MPMIVFRMHGVSRDAFDSTGSFLYPGRWHPQGTHVIYTAEHASLAVLETLIHAGGRKIPPRVLTRIEIPDNLSIESASWMEMPASQQFGEQWVKEARSAVLRVPSIAVNRMESNFVLNPRHPDFARLQHAAPEPFLFDPRFFALAALS